MPHTPPHKSVLRIGIKVLLLKGQLLTNQYEGLNQETLKLKLPIECGLS